MVRLTNNTCKELRMKLRLNVKSMILVFALIGVSSVAFGGSGNSTPKKFAKDVPGVWGKAPDWSMFDGLKEGAIEREARTISSDCRKALRDKLVSLGASVPADWTKEVVTYDPKSSDPKDVIKIVHTDSPSGKDITLTMAAQKHHIDPKTLEVIETYEKGSRSFELPDFTQPVNPLLLGQDEVAAIIAFHNLGKLSHDSDPGRIAKLKEAKHWGIGKESDKKNGVGTIGVLLADTDFILPVLAAGGVTGLVAAYLKYRAYAEAAGEDMGFVNALWKELVCFIQAIQGTTPDEIVATATQNGDEDASAQVNLTTQVNVARGIAAAAVVYAGLVGGSILYTKKA